MAKKSAGLLLYRKSSGVSEIEVLLVHPGGPFWRNKDEGAGQFLRANSTIGEEPLEAAKREFKEELGSAPPQGDYLALTPIKQKAGKTVLAWAVEGDFDPAGLESNTFQCEWPPKSGRTQEFPEVDRAEWFKSETAKIKALAAQAPLIDQLIELLG